MRGGLAAICLCVTAMNAMAADELALLEFEGPMAVVRVVDVLPDGTTSVQVIAKVGDALPDEMSVSQQGPVRHPLVAKQVILAPLEKSGNGWRYRPVSAEPVIVKASTGRALARFLSTERSRRVHPLSDRFDPWLRALGHPSQLARRLAFGALMTHRDALYPLFEPERAIRAGEVLIQPGLSPDEYDLTMRLFARYTTDTVVRWLDSHWAMLRNDRLRLRAIGIFKAHGGPIALAALNRCAREAKGSARTRCERVLIQRTRAK